MHEVVLESANDNVYLCHDATSRRGFAEGAVRAAEWLAAKKGFYDFKDTLRALSIPLLNQICRVPFPKFPLASVPVLSSSCNSCPLCRASDTLLARRRHR